MIMQSSAYLTNRNPRLSNSLSSSFNMMLLSSGERLPPCGVPITVSLYSSLICTPLTRYFLISDITSPSSTVLDIKFINLRSEEHTSELQSRGHLVCRLLLEKKKKTQARTIVREQTSRRLKSIQRL